ncbi:MAG: type II toxin-antitoxin system RelE/ParE family toxin [Planctomycetota bacterium]
MRHSLHPPVKRAIKQIWRYTAEQWGEDQADAYVRGLYEAIEKAGQNRLTWRQLRHPEITGIYFVRYRHHYVFFRELSEERLGIVSVLHERMDLPHRLLDDLGE